ncbi:MAG: glycosyltransferase [Ruminococcus sp.]|nr:glycosyltransferase [Ruminococcus sp.]
MPKISIIVPVYNVEKYMQESIEALCNQTFKDLEIILVDDGSTDSSGEICDRFAANDNRVVVIHTQNHGVCSARNTGLAAAKGEYIGFCDSDDLPDLDLYETLYNNLIENNVDVSMCQSVVLREDGTTYTHAHNLGFFKWDKKSDIIKEFLCGRFGTAVYKMLFKAEIAKSVKFEEGKKINEDKMYLFDALRMADTACYLDEYKYKYIRRAGSASLSAFSAKFFDIIYFADKIHSIVCKDFPELKDYSESGKAMAHLQVLKIMLIENGKKDFEKEWAESVKYLRSLKSSFCKQYLPKNDYIKWLSLKMGTPVFKVVTKLFSKN